MIKPIELERVLSAPLAGTEVDAGAEEVVVPVLDAALAEPVLLLEPEVDPEVEAALLLLLPVVVDRRVVETEVLVVRVVLVTVEEPELVLVLVLVLVAVAVDTEETAVTVETSVKRSE